MSTMIDYMQLCRLCLVKEKVNVPIFGDTTDVRQIYLKIAACLPVKVTQEDNLPKKICDACLYKVDLLYQFWNTSVNAEKQLIQWLTEIGVDVNIKNSDIATQPLPILPQSHAHPHSMPSETLLLKQERPDMIDGQPAAYPLQNQQGLYPAFDNLGYPQPEVSMEVGNATRFDDSSDAAKVEEPVEEPPAPKKRGRPPAANKKPPPKRKAPEEVIPARTPATKRRSSAAAAAAAVAAAAAAASDSEDDSDIDDRLEGLGGDDDSDDDDDDGRVAKEEVDSDSDYVEPTTFVGVPSDPNQDGEQPGPSGMSGAPGKAGATGTNAATESGKKEEQKDSPSYVVVGYVPLSCLSGEASPLIDLKSSKEKLVFVQSPSGTGKQQTSPNIPITKPIIFLKSLKSNVRVVPSKVKTLSQQAALNTEKQQVVSSSINILPPHIVSNTQKKPTVFGSRQFVKIVPSPSRGCLQHVTPNIQKETAKSSVQIASNKTVQIVKSFSTASPQEVALSSSKKRAKPKVKVVRSRITAPKPPGISKFSFRDTRPSKCFCPACGQYIGEEFLKTHIEEHDDEFDFFCRFCLCGFNSTKDRDAHIENEHNNFRYLCFPCNRSFQSRLYYMDHMDTHLPNPPVREFTCSKCFAVCNTRNELRLHYRKHITYECDECGRLLASNDLLNDHKLRHKGIKPVMCEECGRRFTNYKVLDAHRKTVHTVNRPFACTICDKTYKTAIVLRTHITSHSSLKPFQCDICENSFKTKATLYSHKLKHKDTRPFACSSCGKRFTTEMHLTTHLLTQGADHNKTRFTCILCDQDFATKFGLNGHMRSKHDVYSENNLSLRKKYSCDICGKVLANVTNLSDHRRIHTGERPFSCKICNKGFASKRLLHEHRLVHSLDKPYSCGTCQKAFKSKPSLKKHLICHTK